MDLHGVILGIVDSNGNSCDIPPSCHGKVLKAPYVNYYEGLDFFRQSKFLLLPQVYDASPRVAMEAMSLNVPLLMNKNIVGGWKYINDQTGEFFNDISDFKSNLGMMMNRLDTYSPRAYVQQNYGKELYGRKLRSFVEDNFGEYVSLPKGSNLLIPSEPKPSSPEELTDRVILSTQSASKKYAIESFVISFTEGQFNHFIDVNGHLDEDVISWIPATNGSDQGVADGWRELTGGSHVDVSSYKPFQKDQFGPHAAGKALW